MARAITYVDTLAWTPAYRPSLSRRQIWNQEQPGQLEHPRRKQRRLRAI